MKYVVTPHAGVWIETVEVNSLNPKEPVTPHAGVWIETDKLLLLERY